MTEEAGHRTGIVLAGGKSTRLGRDKASEVLMGRSLLQRAIDALEDVVDECLVIRARGQSLPAIVSAVPWRAVEDLYPETGPLGGIFTGLSSMSTGAGLVVACDMPLLQAPLLSELLRRLPGHDAVIPLNEGRPEPLCATYAVTCIPAMRRRLDAGDYRVSGFLEDVDTLLLSPEEWRAFDPRGWSFLNVNRKADLARAKSLILKLEGSA